MYLQITSKQRLSNQPPEYLEDNAWGQTIITGTNNHSIANNEELAFAVILHLSKRVDSLA